jgi:dihydroorotase
MAELRADLILAGGRVIDPASGFDGTADVAIGAGKIIAVAPMLPTTHAAAVVPVAGKLVLPGLIDTHAHVYQYVTGKFGLNADLVGVRSGVSTLVDQGGPSCITIGGFRKFVVEPARSRVFCFISAYVAGGLEGHLYPELYGPGGVDVKATVRAARANLDLVKGVKAHAEIGGASRWGLEVIKLGKAISRELDIPLYIHLGQLWPTRDNIPVDPDEVVSELVPLMERGDVLAHPFTRHPGGFVSANTGEVHPAVLKALERGVSVDVGHGSHFSFEMARKALAAGIVPYTLGADMHGYNVHVAEADGDETRRRNPFFGVAPFCLTHAMTELLALGMKLPEIVKTVTSNAARLLRLENDIESLRPGMVADVAVLDLLPGRWQLSDNSGEVVEAQQMVVPAFSLRAGERIDVDSPLLPEPIRMAA